MTMTHLQMMIHVFECSFVTRNMRLRCNRITRFHRWFWHHWWMRYWFRCRYRHGCIWLFFQDQHFLSDELNTSYYVKRAVPVHLSLRPSLETAANAQIIAYLAKNRILFVMSLEIYKIYSRLNRLLGFHMENPML